MKLILTEDDGTVIANWYVPNDGWSPVDAEQEVDASLEKILWDSEEDYRKYHEELRNEG